MKEIQCYDIDGNSVNHLVQWDKNQEIYVDDLENGILPTIHFAKDSEENSYEYEDAAVIEDDRIKITIPNNYLTDNGKIYIYLYYIVGTADDPHTTKYVAVLPIYKKAQPLNWKYDDNIEFISIQDLLDRIVILESEVVSLKQRVILLEG